MEEQRVGAAWVPNVVEQLQAKIAAINEKEPSVWGEALVQLKTEVHQRYGDW